MSDFDKLKAHMILQDPDVSYGFKKYVKSLLKSDEDSVCRQVEGE